MQEYIGHLESAESHGFDHGSFAQFFVFHVDCPGKYRCILLRLLYVHCQVDNESEDLVVTVVDARDKRSHAFQILHLQHFDELLAEVTLDIVYLTVPDHLLDLLRVLVTPQHQGFDH